MSHSRLSPSSAHRWTLCPGSVREEAKYPDVSGDAAKDGTHSHTLLEFCIKNSMADPHKYVGQTMEDHEGKFTIDADRASRVKVAIEYINRRVVELGGKVAIRSEERVDPGPILGRTDVAGTGDVQLIAENFLEIIDYKDGMTPVSAKNNRQMQFYGLGALVPYKNGDDYPFATIRTTIVQPKLSFRGADPINSHDYDLGELLDIGDELSTLAALTDNPGASLIPGDEQCKWCKAKGNCPALAKHALEGAQVMFANVDIANQSANNEPTELSDERIREIIEGAPLVRQFLVAVEEEALRRMKAGQHINGLKLVNGKGNRSWNMDDDELAGKLKSMGIPKSAMFVSKIVSPAQLEKLTWESAGKKKSLSKKQLEKVATNYIRKNKGKLTIALETDDRAAVTTNATDMFKDVETVETVETATPAIPNWLS